MSETEFLIGRSGLNLVEGFYPDDLPSEWRFEYYATQFKALCLPIDTDEDLTLIFEELKESEEVFELVLSINTQQLIDTKILSTFLTKLKPYQAYFVLFCDIEQAPSTETMELLKDYQWSFQSNNMFKFISLAVSVGDKYLYYNHMPVLTTQESWNEKQIRGYIEKISVINARTILIYKNAQSKALNQMKVIAEILGF